jgi:hypothetical protein
LAVEIDGSLETPLSDASNPYFGQV